MDCFRCLLLCTVVISLMMGSESESAAQQKAPIPDAQVQSQAKRAAGEVYDDPFGAARTDAQKTALAGEILAAAGKVQSGSVEQYVLLSIASDIVARGGNVDLALPGVEQIARQFEVEGINHKLHAIVASARHASATAQHKAVAVAAERLVDDLVTADDSPFKIFDGHSAKRV